jgi:hypothetical protein
VITGQTLFIPAQLSKSTFWSLSFDHVIPLSNSRGSHIIETEKNLLPMCHILNTLKGSRPMDELQRWYKNLINAIDPAFVEKVEQRYLGHSKAHN